MHIHITYRIALAFILLIFAAPSAAFAATSVTNSVNFIVDTGHNRGASVREGTSKATIDIETTVNGKTTTDIHETFTGTVATTVERTYKDNDVQSTSAYSVQLTGTQETEHPGETITSTTAPVATGSGTGTTTVEADTEEASSSPPEPVIISTSTQTDDSTSTQVLSDSSERGVVTCAAQAVQDAVARFIHNLYDFFT